MKTNTNKTWQPPVTIWNAMFFSIFFANAALGMGQQMSNSLLSLYAKSLNAPADQIGQLMSMFAVTALIFRFVSGPAMNAFNRKYLLAMGLSFMTTAYLGFSFAPTIAAATGLNVILVLKAFRLLQGIGNAFGNSCCLTIVSDTIPKEKFTTGMGYFATAQVISQSIGPTIAVFLRDHLGFNITYRCIACVMVVSILCALQVRQAPREHTPFSMKLSNMIAPEALIPAGITFLVAMGYTSINAFLLVYAEERGISGGSLFFTVYALTMLMTRPMVGKLTDRYGFTRVVSPAILMTVASLFLIAYSTSLPMLLIAAFINAFGYGACQPMLQSLCIKSVSPERRGSAAGTNFIALDLATLIAPTVCGAVAASVGYQPLMWTVMSIPILIAVLFTLVNRKRIEKIEKDFLERT